MSAGVTSSNQDLSGMRTENNAGRTPAVTPCLIGLLTPLSWDDVHVLADLHPEAIAARHFQYMKPGARLPEVTVACLHGHRAQLVYIPPPVLLVVPLERLSCAVRCDICQERPELEDLCPVCRGAKWRTMTTADVQLFADAGDRYSMNGTFWRMAPPAGPAA